MKTSATIIFRIKGKLLNNVLIKPANNMTKTTTNTIFSSCLSPIVLLKNCFTFVNPFFTRLVIKRFRILFSNDLNFLAKLSFCSKTGVLCDSILAYVVFVFTKNILINRIKTVENDNFIKSVFCYSIE